MTQLCRHDPVAVVVGPAHGTSTASWMGRGSWTDLSLLYCWLLMGSGRRTASTFSCTKWRAPQASVGSSKTVATETVLGKIRGSQNKAKRHKCGKGTSKEERE